MDTSSDRVTWSARKRLSLRNPATERYVDIVDRVHRPHQHEENDSEDDTLLFEISNIDINVESEVTEAASIDEENNYDPNHQPGISDIDVDGGYEESLDMYRPPAISYLGNVVSSTIFQAMPQIPQANEFCIVCKR